MMGGKGVVVPWVPVLSQNHMTEGAGNAMDHRHNLLAARYSKSASIAEVILHVDHQQNVAVNQFYAHLSSFSVPPAGPGALSTIKKL